MNSKVKLRISSVGLALGVSAVAVYPQSLPIGISGSIPAGTSARVEVIPAANGAEQIRRAIQLQQKIYQVQLPQQKFDALAETMANLQIIPKVWPNDTAAIVRGAIMQADLGAEFGLYPNIIEALLPILPLVGNTTSEAGVERRLGEAYEMSGKFVEAEKHLLAAERSLAPTANRVEAEAVLGNVAMFYSRRNQPREAIKRLRRQGQWPGQDVVNKMISQLEILKNAVRLRDDPAHDVARQELARFDDLLFLARGTILSPGDAHLVESMAQHAQRIKNQHGL